MHQLHTYNINIYNTCAIHALIHGTWLSCTFYTYYNITHRYMRRVHAPTWPRPAISVTGGAHVRIEIQEKTQKIDTLSRYVFFLILTHYLIFQSPGRMEWRISLQTNHQSPTVTYMIEIVSSVGFLAEFSETALFPHCRELSAVRSQLATQMSEAQTHKGAWERLQGELGEAEHRVHELEVEKRATDTALLVTSNEVKRSVTVLLACCQPVRCCSLST